MKRTAFDDRRDQQTANEYLGAHLPCRVCSGMTNRDDLSTYGAQCFDCYRRWQCQAPGGDAPRMSRDERLGLLHRLRGALVAHQQPKAWAYALQRRELGGERLDSFKAQAWREALGGVHG
jgi:hypothetical protein